MANVDNRGFRVAAMGGGNRPTLMTFPIDVSNATAVFRGDVVDVNAAGSVRPAAGSAPTQSVGVVVGLLDTNKIPIGHPNAAVSTKYMPISTVGYAIVALALTGTIFIAQAITGKTPAAADIFATSDLNAGAGDTAVATSGHELLYTVLNTEAQFLILGKVEEPYNAWGEYVDLYVTFNEGIFNGIGKAVGV